MRLELPLPGGARIISGRSDKGDPEPGLVGDWFALLDPRGETVLHFELADVQGDYNKLRAAFDALLTEACRLVSAATDPHPHLRKGPARYDT